MRKVTGHITYFNSNDRNICICFSDTAKQRGRQKEPNTDPSTNEIFDPETTKERGKYPDLDVFKFTRIKSFSFPLFFTQYIAQLLLVQNACQVQHGFMPMTKIYSDLRLRSNPSDSSSEYSNSEEFFPFSPSGTMEMSYHCIWFGAFVFVIQVLL